ncbi:MAG: type II secretion system F family protein [Phycisphaerales bacterium]|nr:MAG: type II secretion system F family protein [Phycisphaerales bacterium]
MTESNVMTEKSESTSQAAGRDGRPDAALGAGTRELSARIKKKDVCVLTRQLATLLHTGMPLVPALSALVEQFEDTPQDGIMRWYSQPNPIAAVMEDVRDTVNSGGTLSWALGRHPAVFSNLFVNMVAAGESAGTLEEVLSRLAQMLENRVRLAARVKSVIAYPLMMALVAAGVVIFLISFVVPSITQIFLEMGRTLPWPTRMLISVSAFMKTYFVLIPLVVCAALFGIAAWLRTDDGRMKWDRSKLRLPLFGRLFLKLETARFARTLGVLLASGVPILGALEIVKGVIQNRFIAGALESVKDRVGRGDSIAESIRKTRLFPPVVIHIIATGQLSGNVEEGLIDIAEMCDNEVEMTAKTLTSLLEPAVLLVMGAVVGFIVLAILLPIFEINQIL